MLIAFLELIEAEARQFRRATIATGFVFGAVVVAGLIATVGLALVGWAFYQFIALRLGAMLAALLVGLLAILLGGGWLWVIRRRSR